MEVYLTTTKDNIHIRKCTVSSAGHVHTHTHTHKHIRGQLIGQTWFKYNKQQLLQRKPYSLHKLFKCGGVIIWGGGGGGGGERERERERDRRRDWTTFMAAKNYIFSFQ